MMQVTYSDQFYRSYANTLTYAGCALIGHTLITELVNKIGLARLPPVKAVVYVACYSVIAVAALQNNIFTLLALSVARIVSTLFPSTKAPEKGLLPDYMEDLTEKAKKIEKCPYSCFDGYLQELAVILVQKEKNNGILVGPAGIGKSAIFETLAWKIAHQQFPVTSPFAGKRLISVSAAGLVAGTTYRGDLETRLQTLLKIAQKDPTVIYYIDEIHKLVGAGMGRYDPNSDIANQLKPALARPGLKVLGATTPQEFAKYIEKDPTLSRRFKKIDVELPKAQACLEMLQARRAQDYYTYNGKKCKISDEAFKAAIFFAKRDNPQRQLPDVANDLIDHVCAEESLKNSAAEIEVTEEMIMQAHAAKCRKHTLEQLQKQFVELIKQKHLFTT